MAAEPLKPCPSCGKRAGELKKAEGARFPWHVDCTECSFMTPLVKLPGIAVKLWNEAKPTKRER
jgi:ssDNA-binding Zn-finger/Zn-ribbon topoisomerase 1